MERGLRDELFARQKESKPFYEPFEVPGLGTIYVKRLTIGEKDAYEKSTPDNKISRVPTLVHCCFDERGARLFEDSDIAAVSQLDEPWIDDVVKIATRLNGYTKEAQDEVRKNLNGQAVAS